MIHLSNTAVDLTAMMRTIDLELATLRTVRWPAILLADVHVLIAEPIETEVAFSKVRISVSIRNTMFQIDILPKLLRIPMFSRTVPTSQSAASGVVALGLFRICLDALRSKRKISSITEHGVQKATISSHHGD